MYVFFAGRLLGPGLWGPGNFGAHKCPTPTYSAYHRGGIGCPVALTPSATGCCSSHYVRVTIPNLLLPLPRCMTYWICRGCVCARGFHFNSRKFNWCFCTARGVLLKVPTGLPLTKETRLSNWWLDLYSLDQGNSLFNLLAWRLCHFLGIAQT